MADKVPGMKDVKPNRAMRRHPERQPDEDAPMRAEEERIEKTGTDDDVSVRAKSSGHRKKTADKWNQ